MAELCARLRVHSCASSSKHPGSSPLGPLDTAQNNETYRFRIRERCSLATLPESEFSRSQHHEAAAARRSARAR
eukprot:72388-Pleurochrysis_carterae.AAC.1